MIIFEPEEAIARLQEKTLLYLAQNAWLNAADVAFLKTAVNRPREWLYREIWEYLKERT